jgi:hypothetical protein
MDEIPEIPEDLGVKVGTEEEAFWTRTKSRAEQEIKNAQREIEINQVIIQHAEVKIQEEQKNGE